MVAGKVYHWKHGWIRLDHSAAAEVTEPKTDPLSMRSFDSLPPKLQAKINKKMEELTGTPEPELAKKVQSNLTTLFKNGDKSQVDWYAAEGTDIADRAAAIRKEFGSKLTQEQLTGMVAVTSAQKRWQENKEFADAIARKLAADDHFEVTNTMIDDYNSWVAKRRNGSAKPHPELKAGVYRPSELPGDFVASKTPGMPKAMNTDAVVKAALIYRGDLTLNDAIGGPKQRSFVNNLMNPDDPNFVTMDTWQYKASMGDIPLTRKVGDKTYTYTLEQWDDLDLTISDGRALAAGYNPALDRYDPKNIAATHKAARAPQDFFQSGPASLADGWKGSYGTYPWFVKQTQTVAQQFNTTPNALQAVAWYVVGGGL